MRDGLAHASLPRASSSSCTQICCAHAVIHRMPAYGRSSTPGTPGWTIDQSPGGYRRATSPSIETREMLRPLAEWTTQAWPHLLWLAPGEVLR